MRLNHVLSTPLRGRAFSVGATTRPSPRAGAAIAVCAVCAVLALGCDDTPPPTFDIIVVDADGGDPTRDTDVDEVTVHVRQEDGEVTTRSSSPEELDLAVRLSDWERPVALRVELTGPSTHLIGAPPRFLPLETGGAVTVPVGPPAHCLALEASWAALAHARAQAGVARAGTFAILAGGVDGTGLSAQVEAFDLLRLGSSDDMDPLDAPAGPTSAVALGGGEQVLLVPEEGEAVRYDLADPEARLTTLALHDGAGPASTVVPLDNGGAAVVGGGTSEAPVRGVTWVSPDGSARAAELAVPRAHPAVAVLGGALLVAGGMASDAPAAEVLGPADDVGHPLEEEALDDHGARDGAILVSQGSSAWLLGGTDETGAVRTDTLLVSGCPDACQVDDGPPWDDARPGVAPVATHEGIHLVGGTPPTDRVDRLRLDTNPPRMEEGGPLAIPRAHAGAVTLDGGLMMVLAGRGPEGFVNLAEVCFPETLEEL